MEYWLRILITLTLVVLDGNTFKAVSLANIQNSVDIIYPHIKPFLSSIREQFGDAGNSWSPTGQYGRVGYVGVPL